MPRVSHFYGMIASVFYTDQAPPRFHVRYEEHEATFAIETLEILEGGLPPHGVSLVKDWATINQEALLSDWELARLGEPLDPIPPLE
jgi:hypothetical protein